MAVTTKCFLAFTIGLDTTVSFGLSDNFGLGRLLIEFERVSLVGDTVSHADRNIEAASSRIIKREENVKKFIIFSSFCMIQTLIVNDLSC